MTKPEGPAQEPQHDQDCGCAKCFVAAEGKYAWRIGRKVPINVYEGDRPVCQCQTALDAKKIVAAVNAAMRQVPATPAPSQPAGAREWLPKQPIINYLLEMYNGRFAKDIVAAMEGYARHQTAAKDADEPTPQEIIAAYDRAIKDKDAAERERDSLRGELEREGVQRAAGVATERQDCAKALLALSKAEFCTPVEGYGTNSSWAIHDLCRAVTKLSALKAGKESHGA